MSELTIYTVNSFVDSQAPEAFKGNPAGVCITQKALSDSAMQAIAHDMNLSETAFIVPTPRGSFRIRWFTPTTEVPLCGHATLASAHVLWEVGLAHDAFPITFESEQHGNLRAVANQETITLDFPKPTALEPTKTSAFPSPLWETVKPTKLLTAGPANDKTLLVIVDTEATVRHFDIDKHAAAIAAFSTHGVIISAQATERSTDADIVSRYFAPNIGILEDPVTGSAHCILAAYWCEALEKESLSAVQASPEGGRLRITLQGERVLLDGEAITVSSTIQTLLTNAS